MNKVYCGKEMKCSKHPMNEIMYIQVNDIEENQNIYYCDTCLCYDQKRKQNCLKIKEINEASDNSIIYCWPPLQSNSLYQTLLEIASNSFPILKNQIIQYFDDLKLQFLKKIEGYQNAALSQAQEIVNIDQRIVSTYKNVAQINQLKKIVEENTNQDEKQKKLNVFINEFTKQSEKNTNLLYALITEKYNLEDQIDYDNPHYAKQQILQLIEQITFFKNSCYSYLPHEDLMPQLDFISQKNDKELSTLTKINNNFYTNTTEINFSQLVNDNLFFSQVYQSNIKLALNKKYTFIFSGKQKGSNQSGFKIGLIREKLNEAEDDVKDDEKNSIYYTFSYSQNKLSLDQTKSGKLRYVVGDFNGLFQDIALQLTVQIDENIFDITDFPYEIHKARLLEKYLPLRNLQQYKLFIHLIGDIQVTLQSAVVQ